MTHSGNYVNFEQNKEILQIKASFNSITQSAAEQYTQVKKNRISINKLCMQKQCEMFPLFFCS